MHKEKTVQTESLFMRIVQKIENKPLLLAFLFNFVAFIFSILIFDIKYETSDDYITDAVLSGAYGIGYDYHLLFGNSILGYILVLLYKLIPKISLYFVLLVLLNFVSATSVLYLLFKKKTNIITICMATLFLLFFSDDLYVLIQFTKVAGAACIAGGLLILFGLWEAKRNKVCYIIIGVLIMMLGSMVRFSIIYVSAVFLVLAFIYYADSYFRSKNIDKDEINLFIPIKQRIAGIGTRFAVCVLVIGTLFGFQYLGIWFNRLDKNYNDFTDFQILRSNITDKPIPSYEEVEDEYNELGLDYVDYAMLCSWNFVDREVYSDDLIVKVAEIHREAVAEREKPLLNAVYTVFNRLVLTYPAAFAVYILSAFVMALSKKRIYPLVLIFASLFMIFGFVLYGRSMYRVEWSTYFGAAACLVTGFSLNEKSSIVNQKKMMFGKRVSTIGFYSAILVVLLLVARIPRVITKYQMLNCSNEQYRAGFADTMSFAGDYIPDKVGFPTISRRISPELIEYIENDSEHYYIIDFFTGIQDLYFNYDPWIRPEEGIFEKYAYYGGCTMHNPGEKSVLISINADPDNPFKSLVNENIYIVDNWGYEYKILYIRRYYYPDAEIQLIDEIDGYKIWRVYIPDSLEEEND